jgi:hypothetical protein
MDDKYLRVDLMTFTVYSGSLIILVHASVMSYERCQHDYEIAH